MKDKNPHDLRGKRLTRVEVKVGLEWLSVPEAAQRFGFAEGTIYRRALAGRLKRRVVKLKRPKA